MLGIEPGALRRPEFSHTHSYEMFKSKFESRPLNKSIAKCNEKIFVGNRGGVGVECSPLEHDDPGSIPSKAKATSN